MGDTAGLALVDAEAAGLRSGGHDGMLHALLAARLDQFKYGAASAYSLATVYGQLGYSSNALNYLKLSFDRHEPDAINIRGDTSFDAMHDMPAFRGQMDRLHRT